MRLRSSPVPILSMAATLLVMACSDARHPAIASGPLLDPPLLDPLGLTAPAPGPTDVIILQDDFEGESLGNDWHEDNPLAGRYGTSTSAAKTGTRSLQALYDSGNTFGTLHRSFAGVDEIYVKFHVLFETGFVSPRGLHFFVLAGDNPDGSGSAFGKAGVKPDGTNFFYAGLDPEIMSDSSLGPFHFYTYHMDMPCPLDYNPLTNRNCFGDRFFQDIAKIGVEPGVWQEIVFHVKMNTPLMNNGSQTLWIDGVKKIELLNVEWRTATGLRPNRIRFDNYMGDDDQPSGAQHVWVDDLIVWRP